MIPSDTGQEVISGMLSSEDVVPGGAPLPDPVHSPRPLHLTSLGTSANLIDQVQPPSTSHLPETSSLSSSKRAGSPSADEALADCTRLDPWIDKSATKRPRHTESHEAREQQSTDNPDYEQVVQDQDSPHLPFPSAPSTPANHSSPSPSPSTLGPALDSPESKHFLTSPNLRQHQSQTSSHPSSSSDHHQDTPEAESHASTEEPQIGSDLHVGTESDSEGNIGSDWLVGSETESEPNIGWDWLADSKHPPLTGKAANMGVPEIRRILERNHIFIDDPAATIRGKPLIDKAFKIMDRKRQSEMEDHEAAKIMKDMRYYSTVNEKTMLFNLWKVLVNDDRTVKKIGEDGHQEAFSAAEEAEAVEWMKRAWRDDDHLFAKIDADFLKNTVPELAMTGDKVVDAMLKEVPRVKTPKPDIAMGLDKDAFDATVLEVLEKYGCTITNGQYLTCLIAEAKGLDGTMGDAENQAGRGGSSNSDNIHKFWVATDKFLSPPQTSTNAAYPRPSFNSMTFSLTVTPHGAATYVHWAEEVSAKAEKWHMTRLRSYRMHEVEDLRELRKNLDNIFEWGCITRKRKIVEQATKVAQRMAEMKPADRAKRFKEIETELDGHKIKRQKTKEQEQE
ncbi:MAG: hypothetical protein Q9169_007577 [Polycauliona sp. 2 TL-2023]